MSASESNGLETASFSKSDKSANLHKTTRRGFLKATGASALLLALFGKKSFDTAVRVATDNVDSQYLHAFSELDLQLPGNLAESVHDPQASRRPDFYEGGRKAYKNYLYWLGRCSEIKTVTAAHVKKLLNLNASQSEQEFVEKTAIGAQLQSLFENHLANISAGMHTKYDIHSEQWKHIQMEAAWRAFSSLAIIYNPFGAGIENYHIDCLGIDEQSITSKDFYSGNIAQNRVGFFNSHPLHAAGLASRGMRHPSPHAFVTFSLLFGEELDLTFSEDIPNMIKWRGSNAFDRANFLAKVGGLAYETVSTFSSEGLGYSADKQLRLRDKIAESVVSIFTGNKDKIFSGLFDPLVREDFSANMLGFFFAVYVFNSIK